MSLKVNQTRTEHRKANVFSPSLRTVIYMIMMRCMIVRNVHSVHARFSGPRERVLHHFQRQTAAKLQDCFNPSKSYGDNSSRPSADNNSNFQQITDKYWRISLLSVEGRERHGGCSVGASLFINFKELFLMTCDSTYNFLCSFDLSEKCKFKSLISRDIAVALCCHSTFNLPECAVFTWREKVSAKFGLHFRCQSLLSRRRFEAEQHSPSEIYNICWALP